jgi:hypothetical protein
MVNALRTHLPATGESKLGRVVQIANSAELQRVRLAGGEELTARLVVLACPLSPEIQAGLRLKKVLIQKDQSLAIAFTIAPSKRRHLFPRILVVNSTENGTRDHPCFLLPGLPGRAPSRGTSVCFLGDAGPQTAVWAPGIVVANPFT